MNGFLLRNKIKIVVAGGSVALLGGYFIHHYCISEEAPSFSIPNITLKKASDDEEIKPVLINHTLAKIPDIGNSVGCRFINLYDDSENPTHRSVIYETFMKGSSKGAHIKTIVKLHYGVIDYYLTPYVLDNGNWVSLGEGYQVAKKGVKYSQDMNSNVVDWSKVNTGELSLPSYWESNTDVFDSLEGWNHIASGLPIPQFMVEQWHKSFTDSGKTPMFAKSGQCSNFFENDD